MYQYLWTKTVLCHCSTASIFSTVIQKLQCSIVIPILLICSFIFSKQLTESLPVQIYLENHTVTVSSTSCMCLTLSVRLTTPLQFLSQLCSNQDSNLHLIIKKNFPVGGIKGSPNVFFCFFTTVQSVKADSVGLALL